jgi:uncharacterized protein YcaQ
VRRTIPELDAAAVTRLWLHRQGLAHPRGTVAASKAALADHLERTGALQLDTINVVERAHYLTLWSRFGAYDRAALDDWCYRERAAYEYWGHEASLLPIGHLPLGRRRMRGFPPPSWRAKSWWKYFDVPASAKRRVLRRLREEGPLESADFERRPGVEVEDLWAGAAPLAKEDRRALQLLWHDGRVAVRSRRHFRRVYDLAQNVYPAGPAASAGAYADSWLLAGLAGCGVACESHLADNFTAPTLTAPERRAVIARNQRRQKIVLLRVRGLGESFFALPELLDGIAALDPPRGTHLLCPFDSVLWSRKRVLQLLGFAYRVEIYVPPPKRRFGYYAMPVLHDGRAVARIDPKLHRDRGVLEIKSIHLEPGMRRDGGFDRGLAGALADLARFTGAARVHLPRGWSRLPV